MREWDVGFAAVLHGKRSQKKRIDTPTKEDRRRMSADDALDSSSESFTEAS